MERVEEIKNKIEELRTKITNAENVEEVRSATTEAKKLKEELTKLTTVEKRTAFKPTEARGTNKMEDNKYMTEFRSALAATMEKRADAQNKVADVQIPTQFLKGFDRTNPNIGNVLKEVAKTSIKAGVKMPIYADGDDAEWINEGADVNSKKVAVSYVSFSQHKIKKEIQLTKELSEMSDAELQAVVRNQIMAGIDRAQEKAIFTGNGTSQFKGIKGTTGVNTVEMDDYNFNELVSIIAALPAQFEGNAKFYMTKTLFYKIYGMTDTNGQPVGRVNMGIENGTQATLLGKPVVFTDGLGTDKDIYYGDMSKYIVNTIYEIKLAVRENWDTENQEIKGVACKDGVLTIPEAFVIASPEEIVPDPTEN